MSLIGASVGDAIGNAGSPLAKIAGILGLCVGVLLIVRRAAEQDGTSAHIAAALPSLVAGSLVLQLLDGATPTRGMLVISVGGACLSLVAILTLGRNFAILPARRALVDRGVYGRIRHPAYLGQWLIVLGCSPALNPPWLGVTLAVGLLPWLILRLTAEERLLRQDPVFAAYFERVRWRLFPGIW